MRKYRLTILGLMIHVALIAVGYSLLMKQKPPPVGYAEIHSGGHSADTEFAVRYTSGVDGTFWYCVTSNGSK